jgi:uncharacterized protein
MEQRLSLITLGVENLDRSIRFYEVLGWQRAMAGAEGVAFFQLGGMGLSLYPRADLAHDAGLPAFAAGCAAFSLAHNVRGIAQVDQTVAEIAEAGGTVIKPGEATAWGGYVAYLADPDGFLWEIAFNPGFPLDADGAITIPA